MRTPGVRDTRSDYTEALQNLSYECDPATRDAALLGVQLTSLAPSRLIRRTRQLDDRCEHLPAPAEALSRALSEVAKRCDSHEISVSYGGPEWVLFSLAKPGAAAR